MTNRIPPEAFDSLDGRRSDDLPPEPFAMCPGAFLERLTPERYQAIQQLYSTAFEAARAKINRLNDEGDWASDFGSGNGI